MKTHLLFSFFLSLLFFFVFKFSKYISFSMVSERKTPFECGFDPMSSMREPFSIRFFVLLILFLIFDVEIVLLFPLFMSLSSQISLFNITSWSLFLIILMMGLYYEMYRGVMKWVNIFKDKLCI